jgi:hypothetical protein
VCDAEDEDDCLYADGYEVMAKYYYGYRISIGLSYAVLVGLGFIFFIMAGLPLILKGPPLPELEQNSL